MENRYLCGILHMIKVQRTMKKILFMLPLVALSFASCEKDNGKGEELSGDDIIQFEDPNFLKALLTVQEIRVLDPDNIAADIDGYVPYTVDVDTNRDGQISVNEAEKVCALDLSIYGTGGETFNVSKIPEIKYFTSLEYLSCYENQLTILDLRGCPALETLWCEDNQLTSINLSKNSALIHFTCYNNKLTSLDLSGCPELTSLECDGNQLTSLDLSNNPALTHLYCYDNQLETLDVSNNIVLKTLKCDENQLTILDVSKNTALINLYCSDNQLTELDLSNNTALTTLWCYNNQLTELDLSNNTALTELSCENNPLTKLILPRDNNIYDSYMQQLIKEYGDIIEYVE